MQKSECWFDFACFGFKIRFLKKNLDRSASFFGQETHEHVKTIKKRCLEVKNQFGIRNVDIGGKHEENIHFFNVFLRRI